MCFLWSFSYGQVSISKLQMHNFFQLVKQIWNIPDSEIFFFNATYYLTSVIPWVWPIQSTRAQWPETRWLCSNSCNTVSQSESVSGYFLNQEMCQVGNNKSIPFSIVVFFCNPLSLTCWQVYVWFKWDVLYDMICNMLTVFKNKAQGFISKWDC